MNQHIQKSQSPAMRRHALKPCVQALGGFVLAGLFAAAPANAQCNSADDPAPPAGITANYANQGFGPGQPYNLVNNGLLGCNGTDGGTDTDGAPGIVGQAAGSIDSSATNVTIAGPSVSEPGDETYGLVVVARGGDGGHGGDGGVPEGQDVAGGAGGDGGASAQIRLDFTGSIGASAGGFLAAAGIYIVAGGGSGGYGGTTADYDGFGKTGGAGGAGGNGGVITVAGRGNIYTALTAVEAFAEGGSGSSGGSVPYTSDKINDLVGGQGGKGGAGGTTSIRWDSGTINAGSNGLFASASAGAGGDGGSVGGAIENTGGDGGDGGDGGTATAILAGGLIGISAMQTSFGGALVASAFGGDGGAGGSTGFAVGTGAGNGGNGGAGGLAGATLLGSVDVTAIGKAPSAAVYVNANGGAGGAGGYADAIVGQSGGGGYAGKGGAATLVVGSTSQHASISVKGGSASAALVQSVGGGGGGGGQADFNADGGRGAAGGDAGAVSASVVNGQLVADGGAASALIAQSIGGSGGVGGDAIGVGIGYHVAIGGNGAVGGNGGQVDVNLVGPSVLGSRDAFGNGGLLAQSIGGAGGAGGSATVDGSGIFTMTIGGRAGNGGAGGTVNVTSSAVIGTYGDHAAGIEAQSIGGGGGKGGAATIFDVGVLPSASVSVGGNGGVGGVAGDVRLVNAGGISTFGSDANGLKAQSIGGGGGSGGAAVARTVTLSAKDIPAISISVAMGGTGGSGNVAGLASINNSGAIVTAGHGSHALMSQSIGGGGGTGGDSTAAAYGQGYKGDLSVSVAVAVGGSGGDGGLGGEADVRNSALLLTLGADAYGMISQSIGGGGGSGGGGDATATAGAASGSFGAAIAVGGKGGTGGHGSISRADNEGGIVTDGDGSDGMFAQSVGGGGGAGGGGVGSASGDSLSVSVGVGGDGGAGGNGGDAAAVNGGGIVTRGTDAIGLFSQSVGGGGGKGGKAGATAGGNTNVDLVKSLTDTLTAGFNVGGNVTQIIDGIFEVGEISEDILASKAELEKIRKQLEGGPWDIGVADNLDVAVSVGGKGGAAGEGGAAMGQNNGQIGTWGAQSDGLFVQSVGGGGGKGGAASSTGSSSDDSRTQASVGLGGSGGAGGSGGEVKAVNAAGAVIATRGVLGFGIVGQSVGGGGGSGGMAGTVSGSLKSASVGIGGSGGAHGNGGQVTVENFGSITTGGKHGIGILAQSVGGGGGLVRTMTTDQTFDPDQIIINPQGRVADIHGFKLAIGGKTNSTGNADTVDVVVGGSIATAGRTAHGIVAQSIGGGGGAVVGGQLLSADPEANAGDGFGNLVGVALTSGARVATLGDGSYGIIAQSIGGGGGLVGDVGSVSDGIDGLKPGYLNPGSGYALSVTVELTSAAMSTTGAFAPAVFAQSVGGGGGLLATADQISFGSAGGQGAGGKDVTVSLVGSSISSTGLRSPGIIANNDGSTKGVSTVNIDAGSSVTGGRLNVAAQYPAMAGAIYILGGSANFVNNAGRIAGIDDVVAAIAVNIIGSNESLVRNSGTITGSVLINGHNNIVDNLAGGIVDARDRIDLGSSGRFSNFGTLEVGGVQLNGTTTLTGDLVQGDSGRLVFAVDFTGGATDHLLVEGHADISGAVVVQPSRPSNRTVTILTATEGVALHPVSSPKATTFALYEFPVTVSGNTLQIIPLANFASSAQQLGGNHQAVAGHLQGLFDGGASADAVFNRLSGVTDVAAYQSALDQISGKGLGAFGSFRFNSSRTFAGSLFGGCGEALPATRSADRCGWARVLVNSATQDASANTLGYKADAHAFQLGGQLPLSDAVALTGSLAYEGSQFRDGDARITGDALVGGLGLFYAPDRLELSAGIDAAYGWYKSRRSISIGGTSEAASASPEQSQVGGHVRAAYNLLEGDGAFVRPFVEGHAIHVSNKAFTETGASPFRLAVEAQSDTALIGVAGVELGTNLPLSTKVTLRPFASAAIEYGSPRDWTTTARFADQPQGDSFDLTTAGPETLGRFSIGADILGAKNIAFSVQYAPEFGKDFTSHSGTAKLTIAF